MAEYLNGSDHAFNLLSCSDGKKRHFILFYENADSAREIECHFIKQGLLNGEYCIFGTHKDINSAAKQLIDSGIDIDHFRIHNLLDICKIADPRKDPEGVKEGTKRQQEYFRRKSDLPKRIVTRHTKDVRFGDDVDTSIAVEEVVQSDFSNLDGSFLCPYPVKRVLLQERARWMMEMLKNHNVAIFVNRKGQSMAIEM